MKAHTAAGVIETIDDGQQNKRWMKMEDDKRTI